MPENDIAPRAIGKKTFVTLVGAIAVAIVFGIWHFATDYLKKVRVEDGIRTTLKKYASDITNNNFDANYYFANNVPRFFESKDMSPRLINQYWNNQFEKIFTNNIVRFDFETLKVDCKEDGYNAYVVMYHTYFRPDEQKQYTNQRSEYELKFNRNFKIEEVTQKVWGE